MTEEVVHNKRSSSSVGASLRRKLGLMILPTLILAVLQLIYSFQGTSQWNFGPKFVDSLPDGSNGSHNKTEDAIAVSAESNNLSISQLESISTKSSNVSVMTKGNTTSDGMKTTAEPSEVEQEQFWRLDQVAPRINYAVTHFLHSIPASMRLPQELAINETKMYEDPFINKRKYLFEFNPSIVRLPEHQKTSKEDVYLASYRVSTHHGCFHQERNQIKHSNYFGIAILDKQLNVLQQTTFDFHQRREDFRLFVLNNDLHVATFASLFRFWILPPSNINDMGPVTLLNELTPSNLTVTIQTNPQSSLIPEIDYWGKSLTYFSNQEGQILIEPFPMQTKEVLADSANSKTNVSLVEVPLTLPLPKPSFRTTEELFFAAERKRMRQPPLTGERGSYCCASMEHGGKTYLLGISHLKTQYFRKPAPYNPTPNQYFSRFYAMEPFHPYNVIAQSGKFCFGWNASEHPVWFYSNLTSSRLLQLGNETMDCPRIHFVSGMTNSIDPTQLIISYGVNDCFARFVQVDIAEVANMLFGFSN